MAKKFYIKTGDVGRSLRMRLTGGDGVVQDLTGKTLRFRMREDRVGGALIADRAGVIVDAVQGRVQFDWIANDLIAPGNFRGEWVVDLGLPTEQTFPAAPAPDDYVRIVIQASV